MIEFPTHAPLNDAQKKLLADVFSTLSMEQSSWLSGFLAGVSGSGQPTGQAEAHSAERRLTVLYGTESGNSEEIADSVFKQAKQKGFKAQLLNMSETEPGDLADAETLLVVVSTWGDGEPPEAAEAFYNALMNEEISFEGLDFSVCALGDTSYDQFCQTGKDIDSRLQKLGAKRIADRVDCDVDFDEGVASWTQNIWQQLGDAQAATAAAASSGTGFAKAPAFDKKNPFPAEVLENQLLSGEHSQKETIHLELSLEGAGIDYQPGDVLAVLPRNAEDVVGAFIQASGLSENAEVEVKDLGTKSLVDALTVDYDITDLSRKVVTSWQEITGSKELTALLADDAKEDFKRWIAGRQIIDLLESYPAVSLNAQQLLDDVLRKLPARLYSIASSPKEHPGEVHLTVAAVRYDSHDRHRKGVASTFLADDAVKGALVSVYLHANKNFRLPESGDTAVIMVGPGTGIAPFRAFTEERAATSAKGDSWLFFGDQCYNEDFLYQLEWQQHLKNGGLTRLDVAFSRDQPEKVYVQHKMHQQAKELWLWLEKGAHFYVCGDASRMAKDVHQALLDIVASEGGMSAEQAEAYLSTMKKEKRYQRDVY